MDQFVAGHERYQVRERPKKLMRWTSLLSSAEGDLPAARRTQPQYLRH